jgi:soluble lytic murein transglycosylase-like protein
MSGVNDARAAASTDVPKGAPLWMRRAILSALAGGGLTVAGLGGPLSGGALAADPQVGTGPSTETSTTPAPEAPTQSTTSTTPTTTTPAPPETTTASTPVASTPPTTQSTSTQTTTPSTTTPSNTQTTPTSTPLSRHVKAPRVVLQRTQQSSEGAQTTTTAGTTTPTPATPSAQGAGNIAVAPQLAAAQQNALAAAIAGSAASVRALDFYRIPLFLLPIYQAAAVQYGVPWPVLAAINEVETNFGTDLSVSTAGAVGWMQFMPETWLQYGVDALGAGYADPYNPVDAIFAAARYLHAAGASTNLRTAILAYNHSDAYVESVLLRARLFASYPPSVIATLTGLTEGSLPVAGAILSPTAKIPQEVLAPAPTGAASDTAGAATSQPGVSTPSTASSQAAHVADLPGSTPAPSPAISAARAEKALNAAAPPSQLSELLARGKAPVVAVEDGRIVGIGASRKLGHYMVLRDTYGDLFTYAGLGSIAPRYRLPKPTQVKVPTGSLPSGESASDPTPKQAASAGRQLPVTLHVAKKQKGAQTKLKQPASSASVADQEASASSDEATAGAGKVRVFAHPGNPDALAAARIRAKRHPDSGGWMKLARGSVVAQGTVLGHLGAAGETKQASMRFAIRPAGAQSAIDPQPILANWRQLDVALHPQGAKDGPVLDGATASDAFLLSQPELERAVLADPGIELGHCDRTQVASGKVSRQALALLVFLSRSGLKPTVGELRCGHLASTPNGPRTIFPAADTLDIAAINGIAISGHQGAGTITDITIRTLLTLTHKFAPKRIVSLMKYPGAPSTVARPDHSTYIQIDLPRHVAKAVVSKTATAKSSGAAALGGTSHATAPANLVLNSIEWQRLITQVGALQQPHVRHKPTSAAIRDRPVATGNGGSNARTLP